MFLTGILGRRKVHAMATVQIDGLGPDYESVNGILAITRRLSDKVLAAFNHAYATGEVDVASKRRAVLQVTEAKRPKGDKRGGFDATGCVCTGSCTWSRSLR